MAARRAAAFGSGACGGAPTGIRARQPHCRRNGYGANDGWCENPADRHYNRPVKVPPQSNADRLRRVDNLYDFIVEIDHNTRPRVAGRGSAVFIHAARQGFAPTAGCVALELNALRRLLARIGPRTRIVVE